MKSNLSTIIPELDNAEIRITEDGKASVLDIIRVVGGLKNPRATWNQLKEKYPDAAIRCDSVHFPDSKGRKNTATPVVDAEGAIAIFQVLPGTMGAKFRQATAKLVVKYLGYKVDLAEELIDSIDDPAELQRIQQRAEQKTTFKLRNLILAQHGVSQYGRMTNASYQGLFGTTAEGLRKIKKLKPKANVREHMDTMEAWMCQGADILAMKQITNRDIRGNDDCAAVCFKTGKQIKEMTEQILAD